MNRDLVSRIAGLVLLAVFGIAGCGGGSNDISPSSNGNAATYVNTYYPVDVGFTWTYRVTPASGSQYNSVSTVTQANGSGFLVKTQLDNITSYNTNSFTYHNTAVYISESSSYSSATGSLISQSFYSPAEIVLPSNMTSGYTEETTSSVTTNGTVVSSILRSITVAGNESITVPAGTFTATKLTLTITTTPISGSTTQMIYSYWYVENVGRVKTSFYSVASPSAITTYEMTSYSLVKAANLSQGKVTSSPEDEQKGSVGIVHDSEWLDPENGNR